MPSTPFRWTPLFPKMPWTVTTFLTLRSGTLGTMAFRRTPTCFARIPPTTNAGNNVLRIATVIMKFPVVRLPTKTLFPSGLSPTKTRWKYIIFTSRILPINVRLTSLSLLPSYAPIRPTWRTGKASVWLSPTFGRGLTKRIFTSCSPYTMTLKSSIFVLVRMLHLSATPPTPFLWLRTGAHVSVWIQIRISAWHKIKTRFWPVSVSLSFTFFWPS